MVCAHDHGLRSRSTATVDVCAHDLWSRSALTICDLRSRSTVTVCAHDLRSRSALTIYGHGLRSRLRHGLRSRSTLMVCVQDRLRSRFNMRSRSMLMIWRSQSDTHDHNQLTCIRSQNSPLVIACHHHWSYSLQCTLI